MIKFFRKIRFDLMKKNETSKYLKYAVGEIVLVMLGILLALQVNNWNEIRKVNELQNIFIQSIASDLKIDRANLQSNISIQTEKYKSIQILLNEVPNLGKENKTKLDSLMHSIIYENPTFFPVIGTYQSALSSGKLSQYSNNVLISDITILYDNNYSRMIYVGEALDDRFFKIGEKYKFEKRMKKFKKMSEIQIIEFQDDIYWFGSMIEFYLKRCDETLNTVDSVLESFTIKD